MKICSLILVMFVSLSSFSQQLVLRGDYPDPSVVKIGDTYWATTSNWGPAYPILRSKDLVNWTTRSHVFMKLPDWADYYFWAPEITYDNGKVYVYYAAHKKGGNLCLGVASADKPEGPYTDHGPLICQEVGSIDAFPMRDENGKLYMIWKEDANSVGKPTPIWISEMNEERTKLIGQKKELFRNDAPWEGNLVEGVSMIRQGGYFYAFYAAAACCGAACTYGMGIARAKSLLGPWEKYAKNPVVTNTDQWTCPGHGTPVEKDGRHYFLYHAYDRKSNIFTGRQGLLIEYKFTPDGWIEFIKGPVSQNTALLTNSSEGFRGKLSDQWQWSVFRQPEYKMKGGELHLTALPGASGAMLGHKTLSGNYVATAKLHIKKSEAAGGLAVIGDDNNFIAAIHENGILRLIQMKEGKETEIGRQPLSSVKKLMLRVQVVNGKDLSFLYSESGSGYRALNEKPVDGAYLPPWDRAIRVGLIARGNAGQQAVFDSFTLVNSQ
jgi:xylan 1,4-beta-xylosidase